MKKWLSLNQKLSFPQKNQIYSQLRSNQEIYQLKNLISKRIWIRLLKVYLLMIQYKMQEINNLIFLFQKLGFGKKNINIFYMNQSNIKSQIILILGVVFNQHLKLKIVIKTIETFGNKDISLILLKEELINQENIIRDKDQQTVNQKSDQNKEIKASEQIVKQVENKEICEKDNGRADKLHGINFNFCSNNSWNTYLLFMIKVVKLQQSKINEEKELLQKLLEKLLISLMNMQNLKQDWKYQYDRLSCEMLQMLMRIDELQEQISHEANLNQHDLQLKELDETTQELDEYIGNIR
ncbi:unnamed protein product [Paramecium sonneborni]|uniref:Uncharacterized protein n=1 Tax=Paramecium sonneborni TaxID=65129 RepID=A0A8S1NIH2_9CILI|nr:unnamed protein product [Paramecium sonneborni]